MKRMFYAAVLTAITAPAVAADVGVSISIGEPGFYGVIEIGDAPRPQVVNVEPVVVRQVVEVSPPVYLVVPRGHAQKWDKYCDKYDACGRRVYFVQESWYNDVYVPHHRSKKGGGKHEGGKGHGKGH